MIRFEKMQFFKFSMAKIRYFLMRWSNCSAPRSSSPGVRGKMCVIKKAGHSKKGDFCDYIGRGKEKMK